MMSLAKKHRQLVHYTTWDGFRGLYESNTLWATHIRFLSDESEYFQAQRLMHSTLPQMVREWLSQKSKSDQQLADAISKIGGINSAIEHQTRKIIEGLYEVTSDEFYVVSFCGEPNDPYVNANGILSQWRAYGSNVGIAVFFDTEELESLIAKEIESFSYGASFLDDVTYDDDTERLKSEILPRLNKVFEFTKIINAVGGPADIPMNKASDALADFNYFTTFFKHRGFKEEREVRLVVAKILHSENFLKMHAQRGSKPTPEKMLQFRTKNSQPVPFIKLFESLGKQLPITRILVGPGERKLQVAKAIRMLVAKHNIEVAVSEIPFV